MLDDILLVDFNDLVVIAVGLSMAYVFFGEKNKEASFFGILSRITQYLKNWALNRKTQSQQKEEALISKIDYYLKSGLLESDTRGALKLISGKAKDVMDKVSALECWIDSKIMYFTKTTFLCIISYDCFLFGLFVLFVGAFQNKMGCSIDGLLVLMLMAMNVLWLHCLSFEYLNIEGWKKWLKPSVVLHSVLLAGALGIGIACNDSMSVLSISTTVLSIASVLMCFVGFVVYLLRNIITNIVLVVIIVWKILCCLKISSGVKSHEEDMRRYKSELDKIDATLKHEDLSSSISVAANDVCTK